MTKRKLMKKFILLILSLLSLAVYGVEREDRIVSLGPTATKQLFLLGVGEKIVGDTIYCTHPEAAKSITKVGNVVNINVEKILELKPDIVFSTGLTNNKQLNKLRKLGVNKIIRFYQPKSYEDLCGQFLSMGKSVGKEKLAQEMIKESRKKIEEIKNITKNLSKVRVFVQIGSNPLFAVTGETFINDIINFAGGINVAENDDNGIYSLEKVIEKKPDVIIISLMGEQNNKEITTWEKFTSIPAVINSKIYKISSFELCSPNAVSFPNVVKKVTKMLHPTLKMQE